MSLLNAADKADAALAYSRRGWSVIPLRFSGTVEERKRPLLSSWEAYQKHRATEEQVRALAGDKEKIAKRLSTPGWRL